MRASSWSFPAAGRNLPINVTLAHVGSCIRGGGGTDRSFSVVKTKYRPPALDHVMHNAYQGEVAEQVK